MGIQDKHDRRTFQHFVKFADDGTVAAVVEVADGQPEPDDDEASVYIDVTPLHPFDVAGVSVNRADIAAAKDSPRKPPDASPLLSVPLERPVRSPRAKEARQALRVALDTVKTVQVRAKDARG
jgi:hypothetical protein